MGASCVLALGCAGKPPPQTQQIQDPTTMPDKSILLLTADCDHGDEEACSILDALAESASLCEQDDEQGCQLMATILEAFADVEAALDADPCLPGCIEECTGQCTDISEMNEPCSEHCLGVCDASCP